MVSVAGRSSLDRAEMDREKAAIAAGDQQAEVYQALPRVQHGPVHPAAGALTDANTPRPRMTTRAGAAPAYSQRKKRRAATAKTTA